MPKGCLRDDWGRLACTITGLPCCGFCSSGFYNTATFRVGAETYSAQTISGHSRECVYSDGRNVTVNYDPHNPTSASISLNYPAQTIGYVVFGFGIVFAFLHGRLPTLPETGIGVRAMR